MTIYELWAKQFENVNVNAVFFIIGTGNGGYYRELLKVLAPTNRIYVYKCPEDVNPGIEDERIEIYDSFQKMAENGVNIYNYKSILSGVLPGYEGKTEEYEKMQEALKYCAQLVIYEKETDLLLSKIAVDNELSNLKSVVSGYNLNQLKKAVSEEREKYGDVPAIIISAGPSLDKNINLLKKAEKHAFIIVVDTAVKAVLRAGIKADVVICIDPRKEVVLFEDERVAKLPAVFAVDIPKSVVSAHTGKTFFIGSGVNDIAEYFSGKFKGETTEVLESGGSVANCAYSLAVICGFKRIILVGQDLAFSDGRGHTKDAYDDEEKNKKDTENREDICEVTDIYGQNVKTDMRMKSYKQWFENKIVINPDVKVVDATEGGALIRGSELQTLKDALDLYAAKEETDFGARIEELKPYYSEEEQKEFRDYLKGLPTVLASLDEEIEQGIKAYERVLFAVESGKNPVDSDLQIITEINAIEEKYPVMPLVIKCAMESEINAKDELSGDENDTAFIIKSAVKLLDGYRNGIKSLVSQIEGRVF